MRIFVKETILAVHNWAGCNLYEVDFLKHPHHHNFGIYVECDVNHNNRDIEFLKLRLKIKEYFDNYSDERIIDFGSRSCEVIADELKQFLAAIYGERKWKIIVDEDGVQGGIIE